MGSGKGRNIDNCYAFGLGDWVDGVARLGDKDYHSKNDYSVLHFGYQF